MKQGITRRDALTLSAAFALASTLGLGGRSRADENRDDRPNVLFIMADDLGYADLSCYGRRDYRTPVLDGLAAGGVMLSHGYANSSVCSATRTALITGAYQYRLRVGLEEPIGNDGNFGLPPSTITLPGLFKQLGYSTSLIGKWHLGGLPKFGPLKSGYDSFFGIHEGGADYFTHQMYFKGEALGGLFEGERPVEKHGYMTDLLAERAVAEIKDADAASRPFFMSLHFTAPHWPWEGPEDAGKPQPRQSSQHWDGGTQATYASMVQNLDRNVGKVLAALDAAKLTDNTIVVFTSDNGGERFSDNWPFIGAKTELLEGGIRVPLFVRWPRRIKAGTRTEQVMTSMDFLPTLFAAAGGDPQKITQSDGMNLLDVLTGAAPVRPRTLYWRYKAKDQRATRSGEWKYLKIEQKEYLFNVVEDPRERANLKDLRPDLFARLKADFEKWNATVLPYPADSTSAWSGSNFADR
jgi:arylsulfatase A-like enzyme